MGTKYTEKWEKRSERRQITPLDTVWGDGELGTGKALILWHILKKPDYWMQIKQTGNEKSETTVLIQVRGLDA